MAGATAIQGVDDTLKRLTGDAVAGLSPRPTVTVGPLDRDDDALRLNWFLYRISPNPSFRNMEPPLTGWRSRRGRPPLALQLQYLLTAFPATATNGGDQEQFAHAGLAAAMQALHANAIIPEGEAVLSPLATPLVEPLRVTMDELDLEAIAKIWTASTQPIRLSVGYVVSLVVVDSLEESAPGPPVRERRVVVVPTMGPRLAAVAPSRASHGDALAVTAGGLTAGVAFSLAREPGDPPGPPEGWALAAGPGPSPGTVATALPRADLAPGARRLEAVATELGLPVGRDAIGLTVVPVVTGPATPVPAGAPSSLETAHAAADVEVFVAGARLPDDDVEFVSATEVRVTLPVATPAGPVEVSLRAGRVAGPAATVEVGP
jgi:hypothetical protein